MFIVYRDELRYVKVEIGNNGIQFLDGCAYFGNDEYEYKININNIETIGTEEP